MLEFNFVELWWPAIIVGAVSYMVLSMIWYLPKVFGSMWMADEGLDMERAREIGTPVMYIATLIMALISNIAIALVLQNIGGGLGEGALVGLVLGVGIAAMTIAPHYMFAGRSNRLTLIQMGHAILLITASGAIIGGWSS